MANKQLVFTNACRDLGSGQMFDLVLIDGGTSITAYVRDNSTGDAPANVAQITSVGGKPLIAPSGGGDVVGVGTTGTIPLWTDGPNSVIGDSVIIQNSLQIGIGLGTVTPPTKFTVGDTASTNPRGILGWQSSNDVDSSQLGLRKSRGTFAVPLVVLTGDNVGRIRVEGYDGGAFVNCANIIFGTTGTIASGQIPSTIAFQTMTSGGVLNTALTINQDQSLTLIDVINFPDNIRQTFNPGANIPGFNVGAFAGDPTTPTNGDMWYNSTGNLLCARINGATVTLGTGGLIINTTPIVGGTTTRLLYDNAATVGEISGLTTNGSTTLTQTSASATAFASGPNGATNPCFLLINNTASQGGGLEVTGLANGGGSVATPAGVQLRAIGAAAQGFFIVAQGGGCIGHITGAGGRVDYSIGGVNIARLTDTFFGVTSGMVIHFSSSAAAPNTGDSGFSRISAGLIGVGTGAQGSFAGSLKLTDLFTNNAAALIKTNTTLTDSAGAGAGTLLNAPTAGNPTKWIGINDNGTTRFIPTWT